ncbi:MAG: hypothetical protein WCB04_11940, partial [Mycobacteriales bacterium]
SCSLACATLADAQAANPDTGLTNAATVGALLALTNSPDVTVGQLLPGLLPRDQLPYQHLAANDIAAASPFPATGVTYTGSFGIVCNTGPAAVNFTLPAGFRYLPGSAQMTVGGQAQSVTVSTVSGVTVSATPTCTGPKQVVTTIKAEPGLTLGLTSASAHMSYGGSTLPADDTSPVTVVDNAATTPVPAGSTVFLGRLASPGEQDSYTLGNLPRGTKLTVSLGNVPAGQDFDLSVFGPAVPDLRSSPLRGSPLRGSPLRGSAVSDTALDPSSDGTQVPSEPLTDVPIDLAGSAVWGVSNNRGSADESVTQVVADGASGPVTIRVSGYNGAASASPYSLLVTVTPPDAPPTCATQSVSGGTGGSAPASVPATTQTLILTNQKRLGGLYGTSAASGVMSKLSTLAARTDVKGVVVPVESDPAVNAAYTAWDGDPCSPAAANAVAAAINAYVDRLRTTNNLTDLRNIVIAGDDLVLPMGRVRDRIALDNEQTYAGEQVYNNQDNSLSAALRGGYILSDDPYGDFNPISWLDGQAYVPDVGLGRLVETPADITAAVDAFIASNGVRTPNTAYTAGYDFNSDGAQQIADTLAPRLPVGASSTSINSTWTKTDSVNGITAGAHGFVSVNGHYDAYRSLPASEFTNGTQTQVMTTADLPADVNGSLFFTIGCHAGLSVADTYVSTAGDNPRKADWAQAIAGKGGLSAANTGYGYGDSVSIAYSEKLMADFAKNLDGSVTVGQALMFAKQSYLHLPLAAVDAKVMSVATLYGLPMYRIGTAGQSAPSVVPTLGATGSSPVTSVPATADFNSATGRHLVEQVTGRGRYFVVANGSALESPLALPGRPLEPQTSVGYNKRTDGLVAHGVLVTSLNTRVTTPSGSFDPVYSAAVPDSSTSTPEPNTVNAYFPATVAGLVSRATPAGIRDFVTLNPGQFRAAGGSGQGYQQIASNIGYSLLYSNSADVTPPSISTVDGSVSGGAVHFTVTTPDSDVASVEVLYLERSSTGPLAWQRVTLTSTGGGTYTGSHAVSNTDVEQYIVQVTDTAGNVASSSKKGQDFRADTAPIANAPTIALDGSAVGGVYTGPQTVTLGGTAPITYTVDGGSSTPYSAPFVVSGFGSHTVVATSNSLTTNRTFSIQPTSPSVTISSPIDGGSYGVGASIPATFSCQGDGITSCTSSPGTVDTSPGVHTFTVTAVGAGGATTSATATYTVQYRFAGFTIPINDPPGSNMSVFKKGSVVPIAFQLRDANGALISDAAGAAMASSCKAKLTYAKVGTTSAAVNEPNFNYTPDTGNCFRYDSHLHGFWYSLGSQSITGASGGAVFQLTATITGTTGVIAVHSAPVAFK